MKNTYKTLLTIASISVLTGCGGGSIDDSFFQADNISPTAGNVCIDGVKIAHNGQEAKDTVARLKQYYKGDLTVDTKVYAGIGFNATCTDYTDKPKANTIITKAYYEGTIIPATKL